MRFLEVYKNDVIHEPITAAMIDDAEQYALWLTKNSEDKQRNFGWARTRRLCLMAFASAFEEREPGLKAQFLDYHKPFKRFPSKVDYKTQTGKFKLATRGIASYKAIGHEITANLSMTMAEGGGDIFVMSVLGTHYVSFIGWNTKEDLGKLRNGERFILREYDTRPMSEIWLPK